MSRKKKNKQKDQYIVRNPASVKEIIKSVNITSRELLIIERQLIELGLINKECVSG